MKAIFYNDNNEVIATWHFDAKEVSKHGFDPLIIETLLKDIKTSTVIEE